MDWYSNVSLGDDAGRVPPKEPPKQSSWYDKVKQVGGDVAGILTEH